MYVILWLVLILGIPIIASTEISFWAIPKAFRDPGLKRLLRIPRLVTYVTLTLVLILGALHVSQVAHFLIALIFIPPVVFLWLCSMLKHSERKKA